MTVPDSAAGKVGKCRKCQQPIKVPGGGAKPTASSSAATAARPASPKLAQKPAAAAAPPMGSSGLDKLFADAGIGKSKGPACPSCGASIAPNTAVCIECGFHLERGERIAGFVQTKVAGSGYEDKRLEEAALNIKRDHDTEERIKFIGAPWWVTLAMLLGLVVLIGAGVIRADAKTTEVFAPKGTFAYAIQKMGIFALLSFIGTTISGLVYFLSYLAVTIAAFKESIAKGFMSLFIPFFSLYYAFVNRKELGTSANVHLIWVVFLAIFGGWFIANKGYAWF